MDPIQQLVQASLAERHNQEVDPNEPKISISTRASQATFLYERIRNAMDYKEEHLIRRNATLRILRRMIGNGQRDGIAENLINELIHARYLPNDTIPQRRIKELEKIFEKYFLLLGEMTTKDVNDRNTLPGWLLTVMATEIDEFLMPPYVMHAAVNAMYHYMDEKLHIEDEIPDPIRAKQIYIAASRALYKNDEDTISYHLLLAYYPHWGAADRNLIREVGTNLAALRDQVNADLNHPLKEKLAVTFRKHVAYFTILRDLITADPEAAWRDMAGAEALEKRIRERCNAYYASGRAKLYRAITRSIVYLVLTKFLIAIILEIPVEYLLLKEFAPIPLIINLFFPPALLAAISLSTKLPDETNTVRIVTGINNIIHQKGDVIQVGKTRTRSYMMQAVFIILYGVLFTISFGLLVYGLYWLGFSIVSVVIFLFFLSLVSLFAYRIRLASQEIIVTPPLTGLIRSLWEFLTIPILHAGKWMSQKFAKINVFIMVLDFVIEAPFKSFVKVTEEWMTYVHEKKEEI